MTCFKPRVSIIASTYHASLFIDRWLNSIEIQSIWSDAELIVVPNDADSLELSSLLAFHAKYPSQVTIVPVSRESLYSSWNRAISRSRAPLIAISNVDDIRAPEGLESQVEMLAMHSTALFSYGPFEIIETIHQLKGRQVDPPTFEPEEFTRSMHLGPFFVWKKTFNNHILYFDEQFKTGSDFDFAIRLAILGKGVKAQRSLGLYLDAGVGLSTGNPLQPIERTAIELRYGIWDKVYLEYVPAALQYDLKNILIEGNLIQIGELVPGYADLFAAKLQKSNRFAFNYLKLPLSLEKIIKKIT